MPDHFICSWEICMQGKKQQLEPDMEQQTGSKLGEEYVRLYIITLLIYLYAEYIMTNAGLDEAQAGIKIAGINGHCICLEFSVFVLGLVPSLLALIELINSFSQKHKWWIKPNMFFFFNAFLEWSLDMLILYFYCIILMLHLICYVVGNVQTGEGTKHDCIIWLSIAKPPEISQSPSLSHYPPPRDNP